MPPEKEGRSTKPEGGTKPDAGKGPGGPSALPDRQDRDPEEEGSAGKRQV